MGHLSMSKGTALHPSEAPTGRLQSLLAGLRIQARIITALMLREVLTRFKRQRLGYVWAFIDPCLHIAMWFVVFALVRGPRQYHDMPTFMFLATGIVAMYLLFLKVAGYVAGAVSAGRGLLRFPMIKQLDTVLARFFLEAATMVVISAVLLGSFTLVGVGPGPYDLLGVLVASGCLLLLALGFGTFNSAMTMLYPSYSRFLYFVYRVIYFTSGAIHGVERLPSEVQRILVWNPVFNGVDQFRSAWSFTYDSTLTSNGYVLLIAGIFFLAGLVLDKRVLQVELGE
jgi:capsular polysaccharide transport system permease protein